METEIGPDAEVFLQVAGGYIDAGGTDSIDVGAYHVRAHGLDIR